VIGSDEFLDEARERISFAAAVVVLYQRTWRARSRQKMRDEFTA